MADTLKLLILYVYTSSEQAFTCTQGDAEKKLNSICTNIVWPNPFWVDTTHTSAHPRVTKV